MSGAEEKLAKLQAAVRVLPNEHAMKLLRDTGHAMMAMADTRDERAEAEGFTVLLELVGKIKAAQR